MVKINNNNQNNKPIWNKKQTAKVLRYLKSKEWVESLNKMQQKWAEDEERERQEQIKFWKDIRDTYYTTCK